MKTNKLFFIILFAFTISCSSKSKFSQIHSVNKAEWFHNVPYNFLIEGDITFENTELIILINTNPKFDSDNLSLLIEIINPTNELWVDTIDVNLSNSIGNLTKDFNEIKLAEKCDFSDNGFYKFKITNNSPFTIQGIEEIGLAIK